MDNDITKLLLHACTLQEARNPEPDINFTGGPLGMDRTCVPKRFTIMELGNTEFSKYDSTIPISWNSQQNFEVVFGPSPTSSGRLHVVQMLMPPLFQMSDEITPVGWVGKYIPIPHSQKEYWNKAFAFNSNAFSFLDFRYVVMEVDLHRHFYKQMYIGFEPIRLSLLHNSRLFSRTFTDDSISYTPLSILYKTAKLYFSSMANMIAVNAIRRSCEDRISNGEFREQINGEILARKGVDDRIQKSLFESSKYWTEWGKQYLPQSFLLPEKEKTSKKKKVSTKRKDSKSGTTNQKRRSSTSAKNTRPKDKKSKSGVGKRQENVDRTTKKVSSVRKRTP